MIRILEIGNYIAPAYAGMILAEQGFSVDKWYSSTDPILGLKQGTEIWDWINHKKSLSLKRVDKNLESLNDYDLILDNFRPSTLKKWDIEPEKIASDYNLAWVSLRSDIGETSFDIIAQAQSWSAFTGSFVDFYVGDTTAGLWMAFKALALLSQKKTGHYKIFQSSVMAKLVEGELIIDRPEGPFPFDVERYGYQSDKAVVEYKNKTFTEPIRNIEWMKKNLNHKDGRIIV